MSLSNKANQARALEQARVNQQTEFANGRTSNQVAEWRAELGTEIPSGTASVGTARSQGVLDQQRASWQTEFGDPSPQFYADVSYSATRDLINNLGGDSTVIGFWDYRYGVSAPSGVMDAWIDVRGLNAPAGILSATSTARPVCGANGLTFNGTTHFLRTDYVSGLGGSCFVVLIGRGVNTFGRREFELSTAAGAASILVGSFNTGTSWSASGSAATASGVLTASPRILHSRRTVTVDTGAQIGTGAEGTAASGTAAQTAGRFTLGASRTDSPALFSDLQELRVVIVGAGVYTAGQKSLINAWAQSQHSAVVTN